MKKHDPFLSAADAVKIWEMLVSRREGRAEGKGVLELSKWVTSSAFSSKSITTWKISSPTTLSRPK